MVERFAWLDAQPWLRRLQGGEFRCNEHVGVNDNEDAAALDALQTHFCVSLAALDAMRSGDACDCRHSDARENGVVFKGGGSFHVSAVEQYGDADDWPRKKEWLGAVAPDALHIVFAATEKLPDPAHLSVTIRVKKIASSQASSSSFSAQDLCFLQASFDDVPYAVDLGQLRRIAIGPPPSPPPPLSPPQPFSFDERLKQGDVRLPPPFLSLVFQHVTLNVYPDQNDSGGGGGGEGGSPSSPPLELNGGYDASYDFTEEARRMMRFVATVLQQWRCAVSSTHREKKEEHVLVSCWTKAEAAAVATHAAGLVNRRLAATDALVDAVMQSAGGGDGDDTDTYDPGVSDHVNLWASLDAAVAAVAAAMADARSLATTRQRVEVHSTAAREASRNALVFGVPRASGEMEAWRLRVERDAALGAAAVAAATVPSWCKVFV